MAVLRRFEVPGFGDRDVAYGCLWKAVDDCMPLTQIIATS